MHADKICFSCLSEASKHASPTTLPSCLAKARGHIQSIQGIPLDCLAWIAKGTGVPELYKNQDNLWQAITHRILHREQTETQPLYSWKKGLLTWPGALAWGTGFRFPRHQEAKEAHAGNVSWETPSIALLQLDKTSQMGLIYSFCALTFATVTQETPAGITIAAPQDGIHLHTLKTAACLLGWALGVLWKPIWQ